MPSSREKSSAPPKNHQALLDRQLVERLHSGDESAFDHVIRTYGPGMCRFILHQIHSREVAEELVQEIFVNLWERRTTLKKGIRLKPYLFAAARNKTVSYIRHEVVKREWENESVRLGEPEASAPDELYANEELDDAIRHAVESLPDRCRLIFTLHREEELGYAEIAQVLGISVKTVETQMGRALKSLRKRLAHFLPLLSAVSILQGVFAG